MTRRAIVEQAQSSFGLTLAQVEQMCTEARKQGFIDESSFHHFPETERPVRSLIVLEG